jgi:hypothetical protein
MISILFEDIFKKLRLFKLMREILKDSEAFQIHL